MIRPTTPDQVETYFHIVEASKLVETLSEGMRRDRRGRPSNDQALKFLLVGMVGVACQGVNVTVTHVHQFLNYGIDYDSQLRYGILKVDGNGDEVRITERELYRQAERISDRLAFGPKSTPDLTDEERDRRHRVILTASNQLLDLFDLGWKSTTLAIDATAVKSWAVHDKRREKLKEEDFEGADEEVVKSLLKLANDGKDASAADESTAEATAPEVTGTKQRRRRRDRRPPELLATADPANPDDGAGWTLAADPDADWGIKTVTGINDSNFFGYHEHTLVLIPEGSLAKVPDAEPPIIRRIELTRASEDIKAASLRMLDSLPSYPKLLIGDSHYHYKQYLEWQVPLLARGVSQVHDLRVTEQGFTPVDDIMFAAGSPHCPLTPKDLGVLPQPGPIKTKEDIELFRSKADLRAAYVMVSNKSPDEQGKMRVKCPALDGNIGCPRWPESMVTAREKGQPTITQAAVDQWDGKVPACCKQQTVTVTVPDKVLKLRQRYYYGSQEWWDLYSLRTFVEACYGGRKSPNNEALKKGSFQRMGITWASLVVTMTAVSYNLRMLHAWQRRTGAGDLANPLFRAISIDPERVQFSFLSDDEKRRKRERHTRSEKSS